MQREPNELLNKLFSFLETEEEVNVTLAGYFTKIVRALYNKKKKEL